MNEKRLFTRVSFVSESELAFKELIFKGTLVDISLKGALLEFSNSIPAKLNDKCNLKILLKDSNIVLDFEAIVVHLSKDKVGCKFLKEELDTMIHLRKLLSLNIGDDEQIVNELPFLIQN
ncbi:MAG: hypothetical protein ACD_79C00672G0001 [uncultured bacterium]|nr:MAG: hypothetical protein ACD_79C00672G0001 [uncultured bacterium]